MAEVDRPDSNASPDTISVLTWNVRGINDHRKVRKILRYLHRHDIDIALLQVTHLPIDSTILRTRGLQGSIHAAGFTTHARGVITWVNPNKLLKLEPSVTDKEGRYTITRCRGKGLELLLVNVYSPNYDKPDFYRKWADMVGLHPCGRILCGGDFNLIRDPVLDRSGGPERHTSASARTLDGMLVRFDLSDVWHHRHPTQGGYTHYSAYYDVHTRMDYWCVARQLLTHINTCKILPRTYSDHSPWLLVFDTPRAGVPPFTWRFPPYSLLDVAFKEELADAIELFFEKNVGSVDSFQTVWGAFKVYTRYCHI